MEATSSVEEWGDIIRDSANEFVTSIGEGLPVFLGALAVFIVGLIVASLLAKLTRRILGVKQIANVVDGKNVSEALDKAGLKQSLSEMIAKFVYWVVVLITVMSVSHILGVEALSDTLQSIVGYVPNVVAAAAIVAISVAAARLVKGIVVAGLTTLDASYTRTIGSVVEGVIVLFGGVIGLTQLGFDTTIITANVTVIVAGVVFALALAFGLGGQTVARKILENFYESTKHNKKK